MQIHSFLYSQDFWTGVAPHSLAICLWCSGGRPFFSYSSTAHTPTAIHIIYPAAFVPHYMAVCARRGGERERSLSWPWNWTVSAKETPLQAHAQINFFLCVFLVCISVWRAYYFLRSSARGLPDCSTWKQSILLIDVRSRVLSAPLMDLMLQNLWALLRK